MNSFQIESLGKLNLLKSKLEMKEFSVLFLTKEDNIQIYIENKKNDTIKLITELTTNIQVMEFIDTINKIL